MEDLNDSELNISGQQPQGLKLDSRLSSAERGEGKLPSSYMNTISALELVMGGKPERKGYQPKYQSPKRVSQPNETKVLTSFQNKESQLPAVVDLGKKSKKVAEF
jgi:hypothetical protein